MVPSEQVAEVQNLFLQNFVWTSVNRGVLVPLDVKFDNQNSCPTITIHCRIWMCMQPFNTETAQIIMKTEHK